MTNGNGHITLNIADVVYDEALYPRASFDQETVNRYRLAIDQLPPILVNQNGKLIDGYHRLIAHRIEQREQIAASVLDVADEDVLWRATELNAQHGQQLTKSDKKQLAQAFLKQGKPDDDIIRVLSIGRTAYFDWTRDLRTELKEQQKQQVLELHLACKTQEEIEEITEIPQPTISRWLDDLIQKYENEFLNKAPESLQVFNMWKFSKPDEQYGLDFPGRVPGQILENLLWYYTEPFDLVIDPMAGGGTTIDVCKAMYRRYRAYDIAPVRDDIDEWDITTGFPKEAKDAALIFLDPPYWKQKRGDYSDHPTNLANLDLEAFYATTDAILRSAYNTLRPGGVAALIISPTTKSRVIHDHALPIGNMFDAAGFAYENRIIVPYTTQQASGAEVSQAKDGKYMLKLYRDLLIYRRPS